jgi:hydrogenase nickel incorporation protein HypA/HybF
MHEFSITQQLVKAALRTAEENGVREVHSLTIQLGELTFLAREQMEFAFEVLSKETLLEGARLIFQVQEAEMECLACSYKGGISRERFDGLDHYLPIMTCPECGGRPKITKGKECVISEMSAEV